MAAKRLKIEEKQDAKATEFDRTVKELLQKKLEDQLRAMSPMPVLAGRPTPMVTVTMPAAVEGGTTTITRAALEGLVAKAGLSVDWNDGAPVIRDRSGINMTPGDIANAVGRSAMTTMDKMVADVLAGRAEDADRKVKTALKATGASDADIAAAEKLFRALPEGGRAPEPLQDAVGRWNDAAPKPKVREAKPFAWQTFEEAHVITEVQLRTYLAQLDAQLISITGLNDILMKGAE
jgi:hypothetical protein